MFPESFPNGQITWGNSRHFFILVFLAFKSDGAVSPESHVPAPWVQPASWYCVSKTLPKKYICMGELPAFSFLTIRTRNNLVQFGIDFLVKLVTFDPLFGWAALDALREAGLFEHGSEKGLQKESNF